MFHIGRRCFSQVAVRQLAGSGCLHLQAYQILRSSAKYVNSYPVHNPDLLPPLTKKKKDREKKSTTLAIEHFDTFHKPLYGSQYQSIRAALLSLAKPSALVNNFYGDGVQDITVDLIAEGFDDVIQEALRTEVRPEAVEEAARLQNLIISTKQLATDQDDCGNLEFQNLDLEDDASISADQDLSMFVPATPVRSTLEELRHAELSYGLSVASQTHDDQDMYGDVDIMRDEQIHLPTYLRVHTSPMGDVCTLPEVTTTVNGLYSFHEMDLCSLFPVLALNLSPSEHVLQIGMPSADMVLAVFNTMLIDKVTVLSDFYIQLGEFKEDVRHYLLPSHYEEGLVVRKVDVLKYLTQLKKEKEHPFRKILINAQSFEDRRNVEEEDYNIFAKGNIENRLRIPETQASLVVEAIQSLSRFGGDIVYCASTLSPQQGDSVIYAALHHCRQLEQEDVSIIPADVSVVDLTGVADRFRNAYKFVGVQPFCHLGQLIVPNLLANFGPLYVCKLRVTPR